MSPEADWRAALKRIEERTEMHGRISCYMEPKTGAIVREHAESRLALARALAGSIVWWRKIEESADRIYRGDLAQIAHEQAVSAERALIAAAKEE